jgi:hypothetical protein
MPRLALALVAHAAVVLAACRPPPPLSPLAPRAPARLSETGLYATGGADLAADIVPYTPAYPLWSDGAEKRRWIRLPPGEPIDTSNADEWNFPVGTKLWKEFRVGARRVETRMLWRLDAGPDGWLAVAYAWRADDRDADLALGGASNVLGTDHDIPAARTCVGCHGGHASFVLGFSAVQLAHGARDSHDMALDGLARANLVTLPVAAPAIAPGSPVAAAALGYLHANCGSCHHSHRPRRATWLAPSATSFDAWLRVGDTTAAERLAPVARDLLDRMTGWRHMPPLATKHVDPGGVAALRAWLSVMPRRP